MIILKSKSILGGFFLVLLQGKRNASVGQREIKNKTIPLGTIDWPVI
jgi:hypothetical protein